MDCTKESYLRFGKDRTKIAIGETKAFLTLSVSVQRNCNLDALTRTSSQTRNSIGNYKKGTAYWG